MASDLFGDETSVLPGANEFDNPDALDPETSPAVGSISAKGFPLRLVIGIVVLLIAVVSLSTQMKEK